MNELNFSIPKLKKKKMRAKPFCKGVVLENNEIIKKHSLSYVEYQSIEHLLKRTPSLAELGVFSSLWSEHCSYKSSKKFLKSLPTTGKNVVVGPGENAGVVRIKDNLCVVFKMESHNHPSFLVPYHGAATGVGGILRDVFCMGARPIAFLNCLRFGHKDTYKNKWLCSEVVKGISDYGNCVGVPTVGGNISFDSCYDGNCLVNVMCVGIIKEEDIFKGNASGVGNLVIYVGSKTGRDGIQGASMASGSFSTDKTDDKGAIQVGDPFYGKLLIEATLEVLKKGLVVGLQDMGAAGLTSSAFEMADRAGTGMELYLDKIPTRTTNLTPYELLLSESQERMLLVVKKEKYKELQDVISKWGLPCSVIGEITNSGNIRGWYKDELHVDIEVKKISEHTPSYQKSVISKKSLLEDQTFFDKNCMKKIQDLGVFYCLEKIVEKSGNKNPIYQQYDRSIGLRTVLDSDSGGAAVLSLFFEHEQRTKIGISIASSCCHSYSFVEPKLGASHSVLKAARMIAASGARPLALTDCLNYGDPNDPEVMWDFSQGIEGIKEICNFLEVPVVSGNVSFYNTTNSTNIYPTPMIGMIGVIDDTDKVLKSKVNRICDIYLLTPKNNTGSFAGTFIANLLGFDKKKGSLPKLDIGAEKESLEFVVNLSKGGLVCGARDVGAGGPLTCLYKMTCDFDCKINICTSNLEDQDFFKELSGSYLVAVTSDKADKFLRFSKDLKNNFLKKIATLEHTNQRQMIIHNTSTGLDFIDKAYKACLQFTNGNF